MKFLYPIKKLNIKPWIKWWLIKKLNGSGESTLKVVTISSGTLQKVDKSKALSIKEYYGNTVQNGTPSPQALVEIQTISGDNTFTINSNSYRVDLGNIELCKIGNYQDKLYYNSGKWYIVKNIGKKVLKGTETGWKNDSTNKLSGLTVSDAKSIVSSTVINALCSHYKAYSLADSRTHTDGFSGNATDIWFNNNSMTLANFKTWLSNNNVTLYYVLATPTTEEITDATLISQLNALYEFYVNSSTVTISNNSEIPLEVLLEYYGR